MTQVTLNSGSVDSAGSLVLKTNGTTTAVTIDTAQNVGVGVVPSAWTGSFKAIQLPDSGVFGSQNQNLNVLANATYNSGWKYISSAYATLYSQSSGQHQWYNAASGTAGNAISFTQAMTLDASGNLLVNQTSASGKLTIGQAAGNTAIAFVDTTNSKTNYLNINNGAWQFWIPGPSQAMTLDSSGNLLVGTTSALGKQTIYTASGTALYFDNAAATGGFVTFRYNSSVCGSITTAGSGTTTYATSSDYRLKNIDSALTGYKERIMALQPKQGTWKANDSEFRGFLAHEFSAPYPSSVVGEKDAVDENGEPQYQGIQAGSAEVIADLVALIQEQQALITTLTERITALEGAK